MLPTWVSLLVLIFCVSVASTPEGEKKELCRKPRCELYNIISTARELLFGRLESRSKRSKSLTMRFILLMHMQASG